MKKKTPPRLSKQSIWTAIRSHKLLILAYLALFAFCFLLGTMGGATPFGVDSTTQIPIKMLMTSDLRPPNYLYPALSYYLQFMGLQIADVFFSGSLSHPGPTISLAEHDLLKNVTLYYNGLISLLCLMGIAYLVYRLCKSHALAMLSVLLCATSLMWLRNLHHPTVDITLATTLFITLFSAFIFTNTSQIISKKKLFFLGLLCGLSASAKYNGGLVLFTLFLSIALHSQRSIWIFFKHTLLLSTAAALAFLITNPYIPADFPVFLKYLNMQFGTRTGYHFGFASPHAWYYQISQSFMDSYGLIPFCLAIVGYLWLGLQTKIRFAARLTLLLFPVIFFLMMTDTRSVFERFVLPLIPFLAVFTSLGIHAIWTSPWVRRNHRVMLLTGLATLCIVSVGLNLYDNMRFIQILQGGDTRIEFQKIIARTVNFYPPRPSTFVCSWCDLFIQPLRPHITNIKRAPESDFSQDESELIIFTSFDDDRVIYDTHELARKGDAADRFKYYDHFSNHYVVQLSPYTVSKDDVPFSPESCSAPAKKDMAHRRNFGPFLEIYFRDEMLMKEFMQSCATLRIPCNAIPINRNYYLNRINREFRSSKT